MNVTVRDHNSRAFDAPLQRPTGSPVVNRDVRGTEREVGLSSVSLGLSPVSLGLSSVFLGLNIRCIQNTFKH